MAFNKTRFIFPSFHHHLLQFHFLLLKEKMDQNSNTVSDARSPPPEIIKLNERITNLEEREYTLVLENYRLKTKRCRLKKSYNRLAGRFLLLKEKYTAVKDERDRLAQDEY